MKTQKTDGKTSIDKINRRILDILKRYPNRIHDDEFWKGYLFALEKVHSAIVREDKYINELISYPWEDAIKLNHTQL